MKHYYYICDQYYCQLIKGIKYQSNLVYDFCKHIHIFLGLCSIILVHVQLMSSFFILGIDTAVFSYCISPGTVLYSIIKTFSLRKTIFLHHLVSANFILKETNKKSTYKVENIYENYIYIMCTYLIF